MRNRILILLAVLTLSATACGDWLDVRPSSEQTADVMFDTYQGYKDALIGCYIKLKDRSLYGENLTMTTVEYLASHWRYHDNNGADPRVDAFKNNDYRNDDVKSTMLAIYSGLYNVIAEANAILLALPQTGAIAIESDQARAVVEAEARAIRAMCHFEVLRLFGQVPGGSTQVRLPYSENVSRENVKYYNWADFTAKIETDLGRAAELLGEYDPLREYTLTQVSYSSSVPDEFLRSRQLRLNYYAVRALQARFYLYVGGRTADAYETASEVIEAADDGNGFRLSTSSDFNSTSREYQLFAAPYECLFALSNHQIKSYVSSIFARVSGGSNHQWQLYLSPEDLAGQGMFEEARAASTDIRSRYLWSFGMTNPYGDEMCQIKKYYQSDDANLDASVLLLQKQIMPMLRLSEMYFIVMETTDDLDEINALYEKFRVSRGRSARTFTSKDEVLEDLAKEYRRELFAEGQMFYWYKRHNSPTMLWRTNPIGETGYIVPLPDSEYDPNL